MAEASGPLSIGELIAALRPEFPDISASKVRYLESEGLITPIRTPSGYRKFNQTHMRRLRVILTAQRDEFLPLRVIRERVEQMEADDDSRRAESLTQRSRKAAESSPDEAAETSNDILAGIPALASHDELMERTGLSRPEIGELESVGLIRRLPSGKYNRDSIVIAVVAAHLRNYGLQARHLRTFRLAADREVGYVKNSLSPYSSAAKAEQQKAASSDLLRCFSLLHDAVLRTVLLS